MLTVVPVIGAEGIEGFVVVGIEELVGEVEDILAVGAGGLDLRSYGIESDVTADNRLGRVFLATGALDEPAAYLIAFRAGGLIVIVVEVADGLVFLTDGFQQHGLLVGVDVSEGIVGLLNDVEHVTDAVLTIGHRDGHLTLGRIAGVGDLADIALLGFCDDGVGGCDHRRFLGEFELSLVGIVEEFFDGVFLAVDGQRGEYGHLSLSAGEGALNDDV